MKSIVLSSVVAALLIFGGCSTHTPSIDKENKQTAQEIDGLGNTTLNSENDMSETSGMGESSAMNVNITMSDIESKLLPVYFDYDKFNLTSKMQAQVTKESQMANSLAKSYNIKLEGNCDEWGSDEYNFALGLRRSNTVKKALMAEGVEGSRISMISYGESNPVCKDKTKECWAKNRRVDFKILP